MKLLMSAAIGEPSLRSGGLYPTDRMGRRGADATPSPRLRDRIARVGLGSLPSTGMSPNQIAFACVRDDHCCLKWTWRTGDRSPLVIHARPASRRSRRVAMNTHWRDSPPMRTVRGGRPGDVTLGSEGAIVTNRQRAYCDRPAPIGNGTRNGWLRVIMACVMLTALL